jgi:hypothetical protein
MRNPGQSGGCTRQSEVESVDIVHTSFFPVDQGRSAVPNDPLNTAANPNDEFVGLELRSPHTDKNPSSFHLLSPLHGSPEPLPHDFPPTP